MVLIRRFGEKITGIIWSQGKIGLNFEVDVIEGRGDYWRIRFDSGTDLTPQNWQRGDWSQTHVRGGPIRGQEGRKEEERRGLSGVYWCQGILVKLGCDLTPVRIPQVYIVFNSKTSLGFYLCQAAFVQCFTRFDWVIHFKTKFFPSTLSERLREPCHESGEKRSSEPRNIIWGHIGLIWDSPNPWRLGKENIHVVSDNVVETYAYSWHGTSNLIGRREKILTDPDGL